MNDTMQSVVKVITGMSTTFVVSNVIKNNVTYQSNLGKAGMYVGAFAIGGLIAEYTKPYMIKTIDDITKLLRKDSDTPLTVVS